MVNPTSSINFSTRGNDTKSISFFDYLFVFVLVIYAGRANIFAESGSFKENAIGVLIPIALSGIMALRWKVLFDLKFYLLIFGFTIYFLGISAKYTEFHPTFFLNYFFKFFVVCIAIKALRINLFKIYELVLYYLSLIALFFWSIQTILGGDTLYSYFSRIPGISLFSYVSGNGLNAIIYSVQPTTSSIIYNFMLPRNSGFAWEPGAFAVYLCLAIFINLFITDSDKSTKSRFWVLLIALLSTQSTTGYLIFMLILVYYIFNKNLNKILLFLPFAIVALIYISTLPFMSNKVLDMINETNEMDQLIVNTIGREESATPQRFTSFMIAFVDFKNNPVLGLGPDGDKAWTARIGANISPISGIGNLLAQFGIVGFLFFIMSSLRSSFFLSKYFNYNGKYLLFLILLLISVSYGIILIPLFMCFWLFELFETDYHNQKEIKKVVLN